MTRASGQTEVLERSLMRNREGSSLLPVPMQLIIGTPASLARRHGVYRVHDIIIAGEIERLTGIRPIKQVENLRLAIWVDILDASGRRLGFGLPQGAMQGDELTVAVAQRHSVVVHKADAANARPRQPFGDIGADAADAAQQHGGPGQPADILFSQQHGAAKKGRFCRHAFSSFLLP